MTDTRFGGSKIGLFLLGAALPLGVLALRLLWSRGEDDGAEREHQERFVDETLAETFPASDPATTY